MLPFSHDDFYVWAMIGLACMERTCKLALFAPMKFDFTDTLFPLIGDGDTGEPDGAIASFLEEKNRAPVLRDKRSSASAWSGPFLAHVLCCAVQRL